MIRKKRSRKQQLLAILCLIAAGGLAVAGLWLAPRLAVGRIHTDGITSYYVRSNAGAAHKGKLPSKKEQFPKLLDDYKRKLDIDQSRVYLTGFSFAGVYAWMLAYDRPELYAGVVPMSAPSYPRQIQENLDAAREVVTVWVRGEQDDTPPNDLAGELRTGRIIESCNPDSRFVLKTGEGHRDMHKYWRESLQYAIQFRRKDIGKMTDGRQNHTVAEQTTEPGRSRADRTEGDGSVHAAQARDEGPTVLLRGNDCVLGTSGRR